MRILRMIRVAPPDEDKLGWHLSLAKVEEVREMALNMTDRLSTEDTEAVICAMADLGYIEIQTSGDNR